MQLYMITDRRLFARDLDQALPALLEQALPWVEAGLRYIQVREKDLACADLERVATRLRDEASGRARSRALPAPALLINVHDEAGVRVACKVADGVHLPGEGPPLAARVAQVRALWRSGPAAPVISIACHTLAEIEQARRLGASVLLFAPVFEKPLWDEIAPEADRPEAVVAKRRPAPALRLEATLPGVGLGALKEASVAARPVPVYALGGVTLDNAGQCLAAGAAGIAGVRLFAGDGWRHLRTQ